MEQSLRVSASPRETINLCASAPLRETNFLHFQRTPRRGGSALMARNPYKDQIAVVGVGSSPYGRDLRRSHLSLGLEAAVKAIEDAGLTKHDIDGICGSGMTPLAQGGAGFLSLQGA